MYRLSLFNHCLISFSLTLFPSSFASSEQPPPDDATGAVGASVRKPMHQKICSPCSASITLGRVFCKKGCNSDEETWEEFLLKQVGGLQSNLLQGPVIKDQQWSAYIDRSPGAANYSERCFHACLSGCGFKFDIKEEEVNKACPKRPSYSPPDQKTGPQHLQPCNQSTAKLGSST